MKKLVLLFILLISSITYAQELISRSSLTGITLPLNTYRPASTGSFSAFTGRMDSLLALNNYRIDRTKTEVLYANADSIFKLFKKDGWTIKRLSFDQNTYELKKGSSQYFIHNSPDRNLLPQNRQFTKNTQLSVSAIFIWSGRRR